MALSVEEELVFREWAPLTLLFDKLPTKTLNGIFSTDLKITCFDAIAELIVLGTNQGICYCYDRKQRDLQRLRCENINSPITCVKVISTVDFMLACGNKDGNVNFFQIPKTLPDNLPASLKPQNKQIERYTVSEMHKGHITALEWSKNGMKLFSGDSTGHVVLTEIDFYMHLCKSVEVLNEAYEVVQICYKLQNLLVSTTYRSIICQKQDRWKIAQVGKQDRKVLGKFGGIIRQNGLRPTDLILHCTRPGLRIWEADIKGSVQKTLLFKESLNLDQNNEVPIINPISTNLKRHKPQMQEPSFGKLFEIGDDHLVTFSNDILYILNTKDLKVIGSVRNLRSIVDIAVNKDEIFILEGERSLIRISTVPDLSEENGIIRENDNHSGFSIKEITSKFQSGIINASPTKTAVPLKNPNVDDSVIEAEEARELSNSNTPRTSPIKNVAPEISAETARREEIYKKIAEEEYDDVILFKHGKKHRKTKRTITNNQSMTNSLCSTSSNSSDETANCVQPTLMEMSLVGLLPEIKSPDSLRSDISEKEKILANLLMFDKVKIDLKTLDSTDCNVKIVPSTSQNASQIKEIITNGIEQKQENSGQLISKATSEQVQNKPKKKLQRASIAKETVKKSTTVPIINKVPECRKIPDEWTVFQVNLDSSKDTSLNLDDWEII